MVQMATYSPFFKLNTQSSKPAMIFQFFQTTTKIGTIRALANNKHKSPKMGQNLLEVLSLVLKKQGQRRSGIYR